MKKDKRLLKIVEKAVEGCFLSGKLNDKKVQSFVTSFKKLPAYQAIFALTEFQKGLKRIMDQHTLVVMAATDLSKSDLVSIKRKFEKRFKIYDLRFKRNGELLGGVKVKLGNDVYDFSVQERINQLKGVISGQ